MHLPLVSRLKAFCGSVNTDKCSIAIIREENIICNQFKHLEKEHSTYLNTLIQSLGETIFVCAVTLIMRFLYSRKEIVSFNVKARIYRFLKT